MSWNSGDHIHSPARIPAADPVCEKQDLPLPGLNHFYTDFFDFINVMAIMIDRRGIIRLFNHKAESLTGYSKDEAVGQDCFLLLLSEQERDRAREQMAGRRLHDAEQSALYLPVMARNGSRLPVCWSLSTVRDDEDVVFGLFCLGFVPVGQDAPCREIGRQMDNYCTTVGDLAHDLLNHSQVVLGYLEMAAERTGDNKELHCLLNRATKSMVKCGDLAVNVHKLNNRNLK
jgi:PAS domain S-box-containing protein